MDEYIKREDALDAVLFALVGTGHQSRAIEAIRDVPTSDVAPKSEVDKLIGKFECFLCHATGGRLSKHTYDLGTMESVTTDYINETYNDGYGEGYKECAREIFEEIDSIFRKQYELCSKTDFKFLEPILQVERFTINEMWHKVAELKKEYTEENK